MKGEAHWLDLAIVLGGALFVVGLLLALTIRRHLRRRKLRFTCPLIREEVVCTATQNVDTGAWQNIEKCSAFTPASNVNCRQQCRDMMNEGDLVAKRA